MPYQTKSNLPKELKFKINVYQLLRKTIDGLDLSEAQVLGLIAKDSNFYNRVTELKRIANRSLSTKKINELKKDIDDMRKRYGL